MNRKRPIPISIPKESSPSNVQLTKQGLKLQGDIEISSCGAVFDSPTAHSKPAATVGLTSGSSTRRTRDAEDESSAADAKATQSTSDRIESGASASTSTCNDPCNYSLSDLEELGHVGSGSSGVVKRMLHKPSSTILVLKLIQFDAQSQQLSKNIATELRTLHGSRCPNIVTYHQSFLVNGAISILMEYMDGGSLLDLLKQVRKLPERYLAEVARQALAGLRHLHRELRVIHRDIKPSNLLLSSAGQLKITDFGVSGQLTNSVSQALSWVGTLTYMSPERIKGESYSFNSDVWSLGLTLVQCAIGRFPYTGEQGSTPGFWELLEQVVVEPAPQLPAGQFSSELQDFVRQCLQKEPGHRASVEQLLQHPLLRKHPPASLADLMKAGRQGAGRSSAAAASGCEGAAGAEVKSLPAAAAAGAGRSPPVSAGGARQAAAGGAAKVPAAPACGLRSPAAAAVASARSPTRPPAPAPGLNLQQVLRPASATTSSSSPQPANKRYAPSGSSTARPAAAAAAAAAGSSPARHASERYGVVSGPLTAHSPAARTAATAAGSLARPRAAPAAAASSSSAAAKQLAALRLGSPPAAARRQQSSGKADGAAVSPYLTAMRHHAAQAK